MSQVEIASLWIGGELSWLEQLCLTSFADAGHRVTLFTYDRVEGVPDRVHVEDANAIYPADRFIRHARTGSPAYHADIFRLHMLRDTDLCWVDTDAYCVRPFEIPDHGHWHGWISDDVPQINNGVLKLPKDSATLAAMLEFTSDEFPVPPWMPQAKQEELADLKARGEGVHVSLLPWGVWGPNALTHFLHATGEVRHSQPGHVLYPVPFSRKRTLLKPRMRKQVEDWVKPDTASIHFWGRRFRAAVSETGGIPHPQSYTGMLLEKHGIDPAPTAHMMKPVGGATTPAQNEVAVADLDFSMLDTGDIVNLMMQRSSTVAQPSAVRAWTAGDDGPLRAEAETRREEILDIAFAELAEVFALVRPSLLASQPKRVADIGAGYAFIDLLLYREFECDLLLVDIEDSSDRHFGFADEGAGYSSLAKARVFLEANGVPPEKIFTLNPRTKDLADLGQVDTALSFISCGFHYPAQTYDAFFRDQVAPDGVIILDIRKGSGGIPYLKTLGATKVLRKEPKFSTVLVTKTGV